MNIAANIKIITIKDRVKFLQKLKLNLIAKHKAIIEALHKDLKKSEFESNFYEYYNVIHEIDFFIKNIKCLSKTRSIKSPWYFFNTKNFLLPEPYGKVLIISPWNFPFQLTFVPLVGAIAAGNSVVVKPSEIVSNCQQVIYEIIDATFTKDVVEVVLGDANVTKELLKQKFDLIFFTGSPEKGRYVMSAASENLTPVVLELGGKCPVIVNDSDNIDDVAAKICRAKFSSAGQICLAADYLLVHDSLKDKLVASMIMKIVEFYGENSLNSNQYARIVNKEHCSRLVNYLKDVNIIYGGKYDIEKCYLSPTIVSDSNNGASILQEEIFGPILPIITFTNINDVIDTINNKGKPLALYLFSNNNIIRNLIFNNTSSGAICVNDIGKQFINGSLPFGGVGQSGMGAYHRETSFNTFSHLKPITIVKFNIANRLEFPPYFKNKWLFKLFK